MATPERIPLPEGMNKYEIKVDSGCWVVVSNHITQSGKKIGSHYQLPVFYPSTFESAVEKILRLDSALRAEYEPILEAFENALAEAKKAAAAYIESEK